MLKNECITLEHMESPLGVESPRAEGLSTIEKPISAISCVGDIIYSKNKKTNGGN